MEPMNTLGVSRESLTEIAENGVTVPVLIKDKNEDPYIFNSN